MRPGLPAGHYFGDRDEKYVIRHQSMRSQGLTGLSGPIATSEIVLRYALPTLTKRTDFNYSRVLVFLINILFTFLKKRIAIFLDAARNSLIRLRKAATNWVWLVGWTDRKR